MIPKRAFASGLKTILPALAGLTCGIVAAPANGRMPLEIVRPPLPATAVLHGPQTPLEIAPQSRPAPGAKHISKTVHVTAAEKSYFHDLASGSFAKRHAAKKALIALGVKALPALRQTLASAASPQMRGALSALINKIKLLALLQPSYVTLNLRNVSVHKVIRRISAQTHIPLTLFNNMAQNNAEINFHEVHQPFWQAIIDLQKKSGFGLPRWFGPPQAGVSLQFIGTNPPPVSIFGPFMAEAIAFQRSSSLQLSGDPGQQAPATRFFTLQLLFACEPKTSIIQGGNLVIDKALTDTGKSIFKAGMNAATVYFNNMVGGLGNGNVNFKTVPHMGNRLRVLKGHFSCMIASRVARLRLKHLFHPKKNTHVIHGLTIVFTGLKHVNNQYSATLVLVNPSGANPINGVQGPANQPVYFNQNSLIQQQASFMGNTAVLSGAKGQPFTRQFPQTQVAQTTATITFIWNTLGGPGQVAAGRPKQLDLSIPLAFHHVKVPFVFHNLPLP